MWATLSFRHNKSLQPQGEPLPRAANCSWSSKTATEATSVPLAAIWAISVSCCPLLVQLWTSLIEIIASTRNGDRLQPGACIYTTSLLLTSTVDTSFISARRNKGKVFSSPPIQALSPSLSHPASPLFLGKGFYTTQMQCESLLSRRYHWI